MELDMRPHHFKMVGGQPELIKVVPYIRLNGGKNVPEVYIQNGRYFSAGGPEIKKADVPEWVKEAVKNLSEEAKAEVGL